MADHCDFCFSPHPVATYKAKPFVIRTQSGRVLFTTDEYWRACEPCRALIDATEWEYLFERMMGGKMADAVSELPMNSASEKALAYAVRVMWNAFKSSVESRVEDAQQNITAVEQRGSDIEVNEDAPDKKRVESVNEEEGDEDSDIAC